MRCRLSVSHVGRDVISRIIMKTSIIRYAAKYNTGLGLSWGWSWDEAGMELWIDLDLDTWRRMELGWERGKGTTWKGATR